MTLVPLDSPTTAVAATNSSTQLNVSDQFGSYGKPNAIVRPVRRNETNDEMIQPPSVQQTALQPATLSIPPTHMNNGNVRIDEPLKKIQRDVEFSFTKELDYNLKHLQRDKKASSKNSSNGVLDQTPNRPRFVCTVPTGVYLQPTKELPAVKHPNASNYARTYAYFSVPKVFAQRNNEGPITEIHAIQAVASSLFNKPVTKREPQPQNIMYDKRVVRGSNYSQIHLQAADYEAKEAEAHRRQQLRTQFTLRKKRGLIGSPPPVKGRRHETVQTEQYLEELLARPIEQNVECQTELFLNPVPPAPFVPTKNGIDASTHIEEGDLFDFDVEVEPILDTLINMTVKLAVEEVVHEEQMADLRREKERYLALREAEMAELRRLEANEIRLTSEKQRRERFNKIAIDLDAELRDHMTAAKLLEGYVAQLLPEILGAVQTEIADKSSNELENIFLPWLAKEVAKEVGRMVDARDILEDIVTDIMREQADEYSRYKADAEPNVQVNEVREDDAVSSARLESNNADNDIDPL